MGLVRVSFVSEVMPGVLIAVGGVDAFVAEARVRNSARGVTGAMLSVAPHFVQIIEGKQYDVDQTMVTERNDQRQVVLLETSPQPVMVRWFSEWNLSYSGESLFVRRLVENALSQPDNCGLAADSDLIKLIVNFANLRIP